MSPFMFYLTSFSFAVLLALAIFYYFKSKNLKLLLIQLFLLIIGFILFYRFFNPFSQPTSRGEGSQDIYFVIVLYIFMLLGMLSQYIYARFEQPKELRKKFDLGLFLAPIFTSPIIFIPLLSAMQNANVDLQNLTTPKIMIFLVAFENGFFWKELFDHRRKLKETGK